ncbi:GntR family transcriptional regulator [Listeria newyorkensis]|uniref:GntR family transcriptional regulator n=1 Tax=Listeria newyorkensis TaxID=1497681 RepID=A0ABX4XP09_9LIST|nr:MULTISPECIES: FadR/GntR family transcriptional regulator [Listeria]KGL44708.1 GntR family transcriptional regulator [Listeriaceae bacterium FSL A5-0209]KGL46431.1 GntR family transcriptional regulator [Listeria newyorkensis]KMT63078.1 GntR family transcriptional regulator [Listeria newyorkensis]PNP92964.1 GntR family transcriptional regulator [Listeria newyorkensis]RQW68568.1 FadR family transcriptional regulator [Listeria sp. SHR_NRA_18]
MLHKLQKKSLVEQVSSQIQEMIKNGVWRIGDRLPNEADLMEQFGVSRNTLREAIRALVHVGLLEVKQGDGTFVLATSELSAVLQKRIQSAAVLEILEVRHALDREAVSLACLRRTEEDLAQMAKYRDQCLQYTTENNLEKFVEADWQLHQTIAAASYNPLLIDMYAHLFEEIQMSITSTTEMNDANGAGHNDLILAIQNQDAASAVHCVDMYISHFKQIVLPKKGE